MWSRDSQEAYRGSGGIAPYTHNNDTTWSDYFLSRPLYPRTTFPPMPPKAAGAWRRSPPPQSSIEVRERVELYLYSLSGTSWPVVGEFYLNFTFTVYFKVHNILFTLNAK